MKFRTKYLLLALLMLLIILLIVFVCLHLNQHQNNTETSAAVSENEDGDVSEDEKDLRLSDLSKDAEKYLAVICAENNIDLNIGEDASICGDYYHYNRREVLEITFHLEGCDFDERILLFHNVAYYIDNWIGDNYSDEEIPLYIIHCYENNAPWSTPLNCTIKFANFDCHLNIEYAKPARSMCWVDLQVNYTEDNYEGLSFDGITFLRTSHMVEKRMEDYSVLKHFPDLERVEIPLVAPKTDEEIEELIEEIKQYIPPDCEIEIDE